MTQVPQEISAPAHPALIDYPASTAYGRTLPKNKLFEKSAITSRQKAAFVQQVEQIVWKNKLAPETLNLPASPPEVLEFQVFSLRLKTEDFDHAILRCIDDAVMSPILFEVAHEARVRVVAAYKRPNAADAARWVLSDYLQTPWLPADAPRAPMPIALHLGGLYAQLLTRLVPLAPRARESLAPLIERHQQVQAKRRELDRVTTRLKNEPVYKRKLAHSADVRRLKAELAQLQRTPEES